ncbi:hypothetical protein RHMOL_Rhmol02G0300600 [Rhododendron molle]|uniref:Uncharacterized protein n=2 Tax=Rhododendron molle TaxID=49168 RepID=A0ACC0PXF6_RHOML|nr:hypothetical protein RHMOL_Rhmol02G0300600 [Rhododendron molle]KAI8569740.1 hypothetical protein RHMOL_Rhmol02G0300600 [Rhododendron molle]
MNSRGDLRKEGEVGYYNDRNTLLVNHPRLISNWVQGNNHEQSWNRERSEFGRSRVGIEVVDFEMPMGDFNGSLKPRSMLDQWDRGTDEPVAFRPKRFPIPYSDEGPSNHQRGFLHGYAEQKRIHRDYDGPSRVDILENGRVELIRKLDELRDQIIRCGDLSHFTEKPRERLSPPPPVLPNNYFGDDAYVQVSPTRFNIVSIQPFAPDKYVPEPLYFSPNNQPVRRTNRSGLDEQDFSSRLTEISNEIVVYDSSNLPQRPRKPPHQPPPEYLMQPYHDHFSGHHMACNRSTLASRQHETFSPQIACSCLQCYDMNRKFPPRVPPKLYNSRDSNWSPESSVIRNPKTRSSIEIDLGMAGVAHRNPTRVVAAHGNERACYPVVGGAPFLTCCNCFGLLKLPRKHVLKGKNQQKVRCGACSAILLVDFAKKRVIVTVSKLPEQVSAEGDDGSGEKLRENLQSSQNHSNAGAMDSWSDEFDNSGYKFPLTDTEVTKPNVYSSYQSLNFVESIVRKEPLSSTSCFPEDEHSPDTVIFQRNISLPPDVPTKDDEPSLRRYDDQQKVVLNRSTPQQNSVEDASVATEIEVSSQELLDSTMFQDSAVVRKEEDRPRINKLVSNASTVYFSFCSRSVEIESSDDSGNSAYESQLTDSEVTEANVLSSDQSQNFAESIERKEPLSSTSSFSKDEHSTDNVIFQRDISFSSYATQKDDGPLPLSDSLDHNEPNNYFSSNVVSRYDDQQKAILNRSTPQQNSVEDVLVETEIGVPSRKLLDSSGPQDSAAVRKEEDCPRINKLVSNASTVYFPCSSRSVETERPNVFVNGQPISDRTVKKAENLAGPIEPGNYWYDYQGGFWGVMGQPCLGIIPPFIEEFRYPMPEDCAAGNTGVFVNGRELNQKDLDLLAGRGLPTTRDRYYVIEICGTVLDENTGEKLHSLGKLAPTVRRSKQGFGMKTPRALAK